MIVMLEKLIAIAREAGTHILSAGDPAQSAMQKGNARDLVTKYDVEVQELLRTRLLAEWPVAHFVGEEGKQQESRMDGLAFVVDPIDGTTNFVKGYRCSAVSIAAVQDGKTICGVVYDPYADAMFSAERGRGAWLNGAPIHVAADEAGKLQNGLVFVGTAAYYEELNDRTFRLMRALFDASLDLRRTGSAAVEICLVACGRAVLMTELRLSPWDYAAAALIAEEAGARVSRVDGAPLSLRQAGSVLAATPAAYAEFFVRRMDKI